MDSVQRQKQGFTLIELSMVLVIIGLIIGGVLVGQDMITAAATRAQIAQIEKYNTAVNTFMTKFGYLPGDIPTTAVANFNFTVVPAANRAGTMGLGDGNGIIDTVNGTGPWECLHVGGENEWFWEDLSANANMIDQTFNTATGSITSVSRVSASELAYYVPVAKLGAGHYITVCEQNGQNYFLLAKGIQIGGGVNDYCSVPQMPVIQAYNIDKKIDDGLPQTGSVVAEFQNNGSTCVFDGAPTQDQFMGWVGAADTSPTPSSTSTCYDNNNGVGETTQQYSTEVSGGSNPNCALAFKMQGAAR